jgi:amino acid permease
MAILSVSESGSEERSSNGSEPRADVQRGRRRRQSFWRRRERADAGGVQRGLQQIVAAVGALQSHHHHGGRRHFVSPLRHCLLGLHSRPHHHRHRRLFRRHFRSLACEAQRKVQRSLLQGNKKKRKHRNFFCFFVFDLVFQDIAIDAFGVLGAKIVEIVIVLFTWGALAAYLVIMGNSIEPILNLIVHGESNKPLCDTHTVIDGNGVAKTVQDCVWYLDSKFYIFVWMICLCLPLGLLKKMSALKYTSVGSLTATSYIIGVVCVRSVQYFTSEHVVSQIFSNATSGFNMIPVEAFNWNAQLFVAFPIMAIAFAFHMNIAPVQMELANPTQGRVLFACVCGVAISSVMYLIMGVFGVLRFGQCVESNVLLSFTDPTDIFVQVGRIAFLLVVTLAFPLIVYGTVKCCMGFYLRENIFFSSYPLRMNLRTLFFRTLKRDNWFHVLSTLAVIVTAYGVAISGVSLGLVFGLLGAT